MVVRVAVTSVPRQVLCRPVRSVEAGTLRAVPALEEPVTMS